MIRSYLIAAALLGMLGVAAGTFGAHGLGKMLNWKQGPQPGDTEFVSTEKTNRIEQLHANFNTGVRYHMYHALALLAVAWMGGQSKDYQTRLPKLAAWAFIIGIVLFSGSLYVLAITDQRWLGMITPIGGTSFLIGWAMLAFAGLKMNKPRAQTGGEPDSDREGEAPAEPQ